MDIETIKTFITLSKVKNFTLAANQLFVAQSTVTNRIAALEKELNTKLFLRDNKSVELTVEGELYLSYAERMLELTQNSLSALSQSKKYRGSLKIGTANSIYDGYLADTFTRFIQMHNDHAIKISINQSTHLLEQLQDNILDMVISYLPLKKSGFTCRLFKTDHLSLVTSGKNNDYITGITKNELIKTNFIMCNFALQDIGQFIRGLFPLYYQFPLEIDDCSKAVPFLLEHKSYSFLPKEFVEPYLNKNILREVNLIDFNTPTINSYIIGNNSKKESWEELWGMLDIQ